MVLQRYHLCSTSYKLVVSAGAVAWAVPEDQGIEPEIRSAGTVDVTPETPRLTAATHIARRIGVEERVNEILTATLDVGQRDADTRFEGLARVTLSGTAPGAVGSGTTVSYSVGVDPFARQNAEAAGGSPMLATSAIAPFSCVGRQRCELSFEVFLNPRGADAPLDFDVHLEVEVIALDGTVVPDGTAVDLELAPRYGN